MSQGVTNVATPPPVHNDPRQDPRLSAPVDPTRVPDFIAQTPSASDILNKILNPGSATQAAPAGELTPAQAREQIAARNKPSENPVDALPAEEPAQAAAPTDDVEQLVAGEDDAPIPANHPIAENFKKLRKVYKENKEKYKELEARAQASEQKVKEYETGAAVPEIVQQLENKVAAASKYEKLHNLKMSDEYTEEFVKPLEDTRNQLKVIAKDYELPESVIDEALTYTNQAQLNGFLSEHFDSIGATEVKQLISKAKDISVRAKAAESEPEAIMQRLKEEHEARKAILDEQRIGKITATAKSAWAEAIEDLQKEGKMTEIIHRPDDPEHNEFFVKPILQQAGQEYGKIVTMLTKAGLRELPTEVSKALAAMTARAHASAVAVASREAAVAELGEMQQVINRITNAKSPSIGSASGRGSGEPPSAAPKGYGGDTTLSTAANLLASVLGSRK